MDGAGVRVVNPAPRAATTLGWRLADGSTVWIGEHPATDTSWSRSATAPRPSRAWCSACNGISPSRPAGWRWPRGTRTAPASTTRPADAASRHPPRPRVDPVGARRSRNRAAVSTRNGRGL